MLRSIKELTDFRVRTIDSDSVFGKVRDFYFDDEKWSIRYAVLDTSDSWLACKKVLIIPLELGKPDKDKRVVPVGLTAKQLEQSPSIDDDAPVSRQYERQLHDFYGWRPYWEPGGIAEKAVHNPIAPESGYGRGVEGSSTLSDFDDLDPHLRSYREINGYMILAEDGEIGQASDFLVDDENWTIKYMVVDLQVLLPGKRVIVSVPWIDKISWQNQWVAVDLTRRAIKRAPEYGSPQQVSDQYMKELYKYYGKSNE